MGLETHDFCEGWVWYVDIENLQSVNYINTDSTKHKRSQLYYSKLDTIKEENKIERKHEYVDDCLFDICSTTVIAVLLTYAILCTL